MVDQLRTVLIAVPSLDFRSLVRSFASSHKVCLLGIEPALASGVGCPFACYLNSADLVFG